MNDDNIGAPQYVKKRRVAVVVFLNDQVKILTAESYCGGEPTFYGLIDDPRCKEIGCFLISKAGLLIAFPSTVLHETMPVTNGERYAVVTWFS